MKSSYINPFLFTILFFYKKVKLKLKNTMDSNKILVRVLQDDSSQIVQVVKYGDFFFYLQAFILVRTQNLKITHFLNRVEPAKCKFLILQSLCKRRIATRKYVLSHQSRLGKTLISVWKGLPTLPQSCRRIQSGCVPNGY